MDFLPQPIVNVRAAIIKMKAKLRLVDDGGICRGALFLSHTIVPTTLVPRFCLPSSVWFLFMIDDRHTAESMVKQ